MWESWLVHAPSRHDGAGEGICGFAWCLLSDTPSYVISQLIF